MLVEVVVDVVVEVLVLVVEVQVVVLVVVELVVVVVVAVPQLQPVLFTILTVVQSEQYIAPPSLRQFLNLKTIIEGQQGAPGHDAVTLQALI